MASRTTATTCTPITTATSTTPVHPLDGSSTSTTDGEGSPIPTFVRRSTVSRSPAGLGITAGVTSTPEAGPDDLAAGDSRIAASVVFGAALEDSTADSGASRRDQTRGPLEGGHTYLI